MRKLLWILLLCVPVTAIGQNGDTVRVWSLKDCIDYAMENNIQLRQSRNEYLSGMEDTRQAKAAILPSLSASSITLRERSVAIFLCWKSGWTPRVCIVQTSQGDASTDQPTFS